MLNIGWLIMFYLPFNYYLQSDVKEINAEIIITSVLPKYILYKNIITFKISIWSKNILN